MLPDSAAAQAGLRGAALAPDGSLVPGDIIVAVGDKPVRGVRELFARLDDHQVGEVVTLRILREGKPLEVAVTLQAGA